MRIKPKKMRGITMLFPARHSEKAKVEGSENIVKLTQLASFSTSIFDVVCARPN